MVAVRECEKRLDSVCIMNLEPVRFPNVWIFVRNERKVKDSSKFSDSSWKNRGTITETRNSVLNA